MMDIVVFVSGRGSNLEALLKDQKNYTVKHVISNKAGIEGLELAQRHGVVNSYIDWSDAKKAEDTAFELIQESQAKLVVLAGFMKILTATFVEKLNHKIINIHPSLLPLYPGLNTHQRALDDGCIVHGATVHFVDNQLDHGCRISQTVVKIDKNDNANTLANKLIKKEHKLLTHTVGLLAEGLVYWHNNELYHKDDKLQEPLVFK